MHCSSTKFVFPSHDLFRPFQSDGQKKKKIVFPRLRIIISSRHFTRCGKYDRTESIAHRSRKKKKKKIRNFPYGFRIMKSVIRFISGRLEKKLPFFFLIIYYRPVSNYIGKINSDRVLDYKRFRYCLFI